LAILALLIALAYWLGSIEARLKERETDIFIDHGKR